MGRKQQQGNKKQKLPKKEMKNKKKQEKIDQRQRIMEMAESNSITCDQGQIKDNRVQKQRKAIRSSKPMILKNYNGVLSASMLQVIGTLFNGVEPIEILEFINFEYLRFLKILSLMMTDDQLPVVSTDIDMINYSCSLVNPEISRSISYCLKKLIEIRGIANTNEPLYLDEIDIKCLQISYLLLIGVGQIDSRIKVQRKDESQQLYFHRITTYLLERNKFLSPKLFYLIRDKWKRIMTIVYDQIQRDEQQKLLKTEKFRQERTPSTLPPLTQEQRIKLNNASEKSTAEKEKTSKVVEAQCIQQEDYISKDFPEHEVRNQRFFDFGMKFFQSDKKKDKENQREREQRLYGRTEQRKKEERKNEESQIQTVKPNEYTNPPKREGQYYFGKFNAEKTFNYLKAKTIDRTKENKKLKTKKIEKQSKKKVETKTQQKKPLIERQQKIHRSQSWQNKYEGINQSRDELFFQDQRDIYGRGPQFSGLEEEFCMEDDFQMEQSHRQLVQGSPNEDLQSSERMYLEGEFERMVVQSQTSSMVTSVENSKQQTQQQQQSSQQIQQNQQNNNNRSVRHQNRQIDHLVDIVLTNRQQFVESFANHIYYQLFVWNVRLRQPQQQQQERRDNCCRRLFQQEQQ